MNTVLVVTADEAVRARVLRSLGGFTVFQTQSDSDALTTLRLVDVDVILRDSAGPPGALATFVAGVRTNAPTALIVALGPAGADEEAADFTIPDGFGARDLDAVLRQAFDKQRLLRELAVYRAAAAAGPAAAPAVAHAPAAPGWDDAALARVLQGFARVFAAGFDLPRVVEMALDAIGDLVRPTRMALLLPNPEGTHLQIVADRGLAPQIVRSVRLPAAEGLARWLATQGRPAALAELTDPELTRELRLLQGIVAVPLLAQGQLVAILVLGQPVVGGTYARSEIETLFDLATQLATGIRDVTLHHQLAAEKEFTERILSHMSSGVISIGRDHRIGIINRRAEEILGLPAQTALGQDLRTLPSPIGDLLFDTLSSGRAMPRTELQLALNKLWLEVSTYVVRGEEPLPLGAVIVFEDLTAQKELQEKKREADQVQLLTRVVARIADEIKNPLVSINTFVELIGERYDDPEFRRHFSAIVRRDVRRLVDILEKLAGLVTEGELNFLVVDAQEVVEQLVEATDIEDEEADKHVELELAAATEPLLVKVDPAQLGKALTYLVRYLAWSSTEERPKISLSVARHEDGAGGVRIMVASRSARVTPDRAQHLFDPVQMVQESLVDVGPAVSQRLVEALGGRLHLREGRHQVAFVISLPAANP